MKPAAQDDIDRRHIWRVSPDGGKPVRLTTGNGVETGRHDPERVEPGVDPEVLVLDRGGRVDDLARQLVEGDHFALQVTQARQFDLAGHETYVLADLFDLPVELTNRFQWVVEHTCFCAIEPGRRLEYVQGVLRALQPGGALLAIFFLNPWDPGEAPEAGGPPFAVTREELDELFGKS